MYRDTTHWVSGLAVASLVLAGCPGDDSGEDAGGASTTDTPVGTTSPDPGSTGMPATTTGMGMTSTPDPDTGTTAAPPDDTTAGVAETGPPIYFDLGSIPESPISKGPCGKVDFLFVIDNSGSMSDEQANLVASFPGFISAIQSTLETVNEYHVGVTTTDDYTYNTAVPGCNVMGGLVVQTGGGNSSNMACGPYDAGENYMTEADDLAVSFACAAQVGTSGSGYEQPMQALQNAIDPNHPLSMPGGCNEGFIREDALLVLVIITDEADGPGDSEGTTSPGTPMDWYDAVVAAKDGIPENVVVVVLAAYYGGTCPPTSPVYDGVNMITFADMFGDNGLYGGICDPDYSPTFLDAVSVIDVACDNFVPPN